MHPFLNEQTDRLEKLNKADEAHIQGPSKVRILNISFKKKKLGWVDGWIDR